jgi:DNA-binding response OmpR family regulator
VTVYDTAAAALEHFERQPASIVVADLAPAMDGVSGQRLLRKLMERKPPLPKVYLMAEQWMPVQQQWSLKLGAAGTLQRDPTNIASLLVGVSAAPSRRTQRTIRAIDDQFLRHAGPLASAQLERLKASLDNDELKDLQIYVERLAALLTNSHTRATFVRQVQRIPGAETTTAQSTVGDPWMQSVNQLFAKYAGGLAARLAISHALGQVESNGVFSRPAYLGALSKQLLDPGRAAAFLDAARSANLDP